MLEDAITGRKIETVPYIREFERRRAKLTTAEWDAIVGALTAQLDTTSVGKSISASWIPGSDWTGTVYMPIYTNACGCNFEAAALFLGSIVKWSVIHHDSQWRSVKQPKSKNDPDGVETTLYWRVD